MKKSVRLISFAGAAAVFLAFAAVENSRAADASTPGEAPVEFTFDVIAPDTLKFTFKVKVNTDKPILEVHAAIKEMDPDGRDRKSADL